MMSGFFFFFTARGVYTAKYPLELKSFISRVNLICTPCGSYLLTFYYSKSYVIHDTAPCSDCRLWVVFFHGPSCHLLSTSNVSVKVGAHACMYACTCILLA
jgi:hypothetical protein